MCSIERKLLSTGLGRPTNALETACWVAEEAIWTGNLTTSPKMSSGTRDACCPDLNYAELNAKLCALRDLRDLVK
jgi:hypothetical protein